MKKIDATTGSIVFSDQPSEVFTVVGSCVAFCVFDKKRRVGGLCHYALPEVKPDASAKSEGYYGQEGIKALLKKFKEGGSVPSDLVVKIVGGGNVATSSKEIGTLNSDFALKICRDFGLFLESKSTGGESGKQLRFLTHTGELFVRKNKQIHTNSKNLGTEAAPIRCVTGTTSETQPLAVIKKKRKELSFPIKVLIVDDSVVIQKIFEKTFSKDERFKVVGVAADPFEADELLKNTTPDLMTLDLHMPRMDGITYLGKLMKDPKFPVLVVSGAQNENGEAALRATEVGAIDFVPKPDASQLKNFAEVLIDKSLAAASVDTRKLKPSIDFSSSHSPQVRTASNNLTINTSKPILIGSSTGGTVALTNLLTSLPANIPPIAVVQHIPPHFSLLFANRLNSLCAFEVKEAKDGDLLTPGVCYIAPGDFQMRIVKGNRLRVIDEPPVNRHKPSVDVLFDSAIELLGANAIGVILTGMGKDGAKGLLKMKQAGCHTIGQSEETCVVYGMPREAYEIGALVEVLDLQDIAAGLIKQLAGRKAS